MGAQLQILREQLSKIAGGDARLVQQLELQVALTKFTGFGQSQTSEDVEIDTTGTTFSVNLPIGRHFVDFVGMFTVVGGTGADGIFIEGTGTAAISAGYLASVLGDGAGTIMSAAATTGAFGFSGVDGVLMVRGFIDVQRAGVFGFNVKVQGAPTSVTLLAGSGLTTTIQREA